MVKEERPDWRCQHEGHARLFMLTWSLKVIPRDAGKMLLPVSSVRALWRASRGCRRAAGLHNAEVHQQDTSATCGDVGSNWTKTTDPLPAEAWWSLPKPRASPLLPATSLSYFPNFLFSFSIYLRSVFSRPGQAFPDALGVSSFSETSLAAHKHGAVLLSLSHSPGAATQILAALLCFV